MLVMSLILSIIALVRYVRFALFMLTVNVRFKAAALSFLFAAAFLFSSVSVSADFCLDSVSETGSFAVSPVEALGTAYITRAALGALGVEIAGSLLSLSSDDVARALWYGGGSTLPPDFTYSENLYEYFSRETIRIRPDSVTIGGVEYSDVWLPHDAADKFRTNAFDFITRYNLQSESDGIFVSGSGSLAGIPIFSDSSSGHFVSQTYFCGSSGSYSVGSGFVSFGSSNYPIVEWNYGSGVLSTQFNSSPPSPRSFAVRFESSPNFDSSSFRFQAFAQFPDTSVHYKRSNFISSSSVGLDLTPFDFTWVSSVIPVTPLPSSYGLRTRVPSTYVKDLPQILDPDSSTYDADLASLISGLESSASEGTLTDPAFEEWDIPVPPTSNTIANEPYSSLSGALSGISSFLNSISSSVSGIAESIISGDAGFFGNVVSALAAPFEPVFAIFRSGVGIWHYVVSWVGTISAPFSWSLSALGSAGSYFLSPIYAAVAASVVLAVYKKFGR